MGRLSRVAPALVAGLLLAMLLVATNPVAAAAKDFATFGTPTASGSFGEDIEFRQPVTLDGPIGRAELLVTFADAIGPTVIEAPAPSGTGAQVLSYTMRIADQGHILPNTPLQASWRISSSADPTATLTGPKTSLRYADERFDWRTKTGKIVRVHWYEGSDAFGQRALEIGEQGVEKAAALLGVTETEPVDFYIYASQEPFYDALGPGTRENVGGQADAEIRTLFALIPPSEIDDSWVHAVIPHELTHLVFDTAVHNAYHFPPRWLNEGLAVYESEGYGPQDRGDVEAAANDGEIMPLTALTGQFPTSGDRFRLAYSESVSGVDYLVRTFGKDALVGLITSYKDGRTDDEAFQAAIGQTMTAFSDAWLADLDAKVPVKAGPQPAPAGPVPAAWSTGPVTAPGRTASPDPAVVAPGSTGAPVTAPDAPDEGSNGSTFVIVIFLIGAVIIVGSIVIARRRRDAAT